MKWQIFAVLFIAVTILSAQTTLPPSWTGVETVQLSTQCALHNQDSVICVATDGVNFSYQGAPFVKLNLAGPAGPAGPIGPTGATGPIGPQGPPGTGQSFNSLTCGTSNLSNAGLTATSCKETTP